MKKALIFITVFILAFGCMATVPSVNVFATTKTQIIVQPNIIVENVLSYERNTQRKAKLIGSWDDLSDTTYAYKELSFFNGYTCTGSYITYSSQWSDTFFDYRYKYVNYTYSTY